MTTIKIHTRFKYILSDRIHQNLLMLQDYSESPSESSLDDNSLVIPSCSYNLADFAQCSVGSSDLSIIVDGTILGGT